MHLRYLSAVARGIKIQIVLFWLMLLSATHVAGQKNLLRNGGFEQIELDTNMVSWVNSEITPYRVNDTAIGWNFCKREMVLIYSRDWNFENYDWHTSMTYYTDSGYSRTGKVFAALTLYRIGAREILSINNLCGRLCAPMVAGHHYHVSFYIKALEGNLYTNQFNVAFTDTFTTTHYALERDEISKHGADLHIQTAYSVPGILESRTYTRYTFEYTALGGERFIYMGNFHLGYMQGRNAKKAGWFGPSKNAWTQQPYTEYAVDDIVVEPVDTSEGCNEMVAVNAQKQIAVIEPDTIQLPPVYFDYNDSITLWSITKMADTLNVLKEYHRILVYGFTDNTGSLAYNQQLSAQRAAFVRSKLQCLTNKIIIAKGLGLSNATMDVKLQRRVDILLVK